VHGRSLDLSLGAAQKIGIINTNRVTECFTIVFTLDFME